MGEAWRAASFFSKLAEQPRGVKKNPKNLEVKTKGNEKAGFVLFVCLFKSRMLVTIRHSETTLMA